MDRKHIKVDKNWKIEKLSPQFSFLHVSQYGTLPVLPGFAMAPHICSAHVEKQNLDLLKMKVPDKYMKTKLLPILQGGIISKKKKKKKKTSWSPDR